MLMFVVVFCAAGAVIIVGLSAYSEFHDMWAHPDHRALGGGSRYPKPRLR